MMRHATRTKTPTPAARAGASRTDDAPTPSRVSRVGRWLCLGGAALGMLGVLGWISGQTHLTTLLPKQPPMMPNTSVALILLGLSGALLCEVAFRPRSRVLSLIAASLVAILGIGTIVQYIAGVELFLDQLLMQVDADSVSGRPALPTAVSLTLLSLAILAFNVRPNAATRPSDWLVVGGALSALIGLTGQILGAGPLYRLPRTNVIGVAMPTAISLLLISTGLLLARPGAGVMAMIASRGSGGVVIRRLALPTILVPIAIGFVGLRLFAIMRVDDFPIVVAALAVAMIIVGLALLTITARLLNNSYEAMMASQARARDIIENAADGIFIADRDGRYVEVNEAACKLLGVSAQQIVGRSMGDFLPPEDLPRLDQAKEVMLAGTIHIDEWHIRHAGGHLIPIEVSARILPSGQWQGLVRDISKRKAAEELARQAMAARERLSQELREARSFLENVLESSVEHGLVALDLDRRIVFWNEGAHRMFGYSSEESIGRSADRLHDPADIASGLAPSLYARALDVGSAEALMRLQRKGGAEFISHIVASRRTTSHGTPSGYLLVSRDVTREQREMEHERLLAAFGLLLASSLERDQLVHSAAGLLVREFSDACVVDIAERPEAEATGWRSRVVHRDSRRKQLTEALEGLRRDGQPPFFARAAVEERRTTVVSHVTDEFLDSVAMSPEHRRLMGELAPLSLISVPLQARGLLLGALTFVSSDARRRYNEDDRSFVAEIGERLALALDNARLFEAANAAIRARDEVMRVVAHDLRNPLSTILMQASSLRSNGVEEDGSAKQRGIAIEHAVKRMNRLIQDLLDVARLEAGQLSVQPAAVSAGDLVMAAVDAQRELAVHASQEIRAEVRAGLHPIWADPDRVLQILENLISNATRFTGAGGTVTVGVAPHNSEVYFWVSDTGIGISEEDLPRVFDRFWQARGGEKRRGGAGLGLAIVKGLVEAQGGRVWAHSTVGQGSSFYFALPVAHDPKHDRRSSSVRRRNLLGRRKPSTTGSAHDGA